MSQTKSTSSRLRTLSLSCLAILALSTTVVHGQEAVKALPPSIDWAESDSKRLAHSRREITVAVIDTGADLDHPALRRHFWRGPNGIKGWNFLQKNQDLHDHHGHGTHVAGVIARIAPEARIMILKYYEPRVTPEETLRATTDALRFAVYHHADVINYSGGGLLPNAEEEWALREAEKAGILVVAAAGNESQNSDRQPFYPANYSLRNILSVGAIGNRGPLSSSNFGLTSVDISTVGENLISSLPHAQWGPMTGTSQATAVVSGAAALWMGHQMRRPQPRETIDHLSRSGVEVQGLLGRNRLGRRLSIRQALEMKGENTSVFGNGEVHSEKWITRRPADLSTNKID